MYAVRSGTTKSEGRSARRSKCADAAAAARDAGAAVAIGIAVTLGRDAEANGVEFDTEDVALRNRIIAHDDRRRPAKVLAAGCGQSIFEEPDSSHEKASMEGGGTWVPPTGPPEYSSLH